MRIWHTYFNETYNFYTDSYPPNNTRSYFENRYGQARVESKELPDEVIGQLNHSAGTGIVQACNVGGPIQDGQWSYRWPVSPSGPQIQVKKINERFGKVNPGKFGLKGDMNTDAIEQLIGDGKRFFLTSGGQQLLNNILSGVS